MNSSMLHIMLLVIFTLLINITEANIDQKRFLTLAEVSAQTEAEEQPKGLRISLAKKSKSDLKMM